MKVTKDENVELYKVLFEDWSNYDKWSPKFAEFVRMAHEKYHIIPGIQWPAGLNINDKVKQDFIVWLNDMGVNLSENLLK